MLLVLYLYPPNSDACYTDSILLQVVATFYLREMGQAGCTWTLMSQIRIWPMTYGS